MDRVDLAQCLLHGEAPDGYPRSPSIAGRQVGTKTQPIANAAISSGAECEIASANPAAADVYRRYAHSVARWASHLLGPFSDVEDVVQEVFAIVLRRLPTFRGDAKLTTWLYRITRNVVRSHRRRLRVRAWWNRPSSSAEVDQVASLAPTPLDDLERRHREIILYQVLDSMSERSRTLLILFEIEELSGVEISARMDTKVGTVWVQLHRARTEFIRRFAELERRGLV